MNGLLFYTPNDIQKLLSILYSSLEEQLFLKELCKFIKEFTNEKQISIYKINSDESVELISLNGTSINNTTSHKIKSGEGIIGHVVKTKHAYYSNLLLRDPLYNESHYNNSYKIIAELCVPIVVNNQVLATINLQSSSTETKYDFNHLSMIQNILNEIKKPLINLQMYLASKHLNEVLTKKLDNESRSSSPINTNNLSFYKKISSPIEDVSNSSQANLVGNSNCFKKTLYLAEKIAKTRSNILINGNIGTGKTSLAYYIYNKSKIDKEKLILVDCHKLKELINLRNTAASFAISINVIEESPLYEAISLIKNHGTIILKNIQNLPLTYQLELLNLLQNRTGIRIIITTNQKVNDLIQKGKLSKQLFHELNYLQIDLPTLNERNEDIPQLVEYYFNNKSNQSKVYKMNEEAINILKAYAWPSNIKELWKTLNCATVMTDINTINASHLPDHIRPKHMIDPSVTGHNEEFEAFVIQTLDSLEKKYITMTLQKLEGNKSQTAKALGITVKTLYNKLHHHDMSDFIKKS
ncbi:MAG: sigma-54-dependent Fis family transcriptional regulator [Oligoflexia bacterium]|nr:sigma-54-dependent Fis family transcriptional regulator [Oligoflexia bacterium]